MKKLFEKADKHVLNTVTALHSRTNNIIVHLITMMGNAGVFWWILSVPFFISRNYRYVGLNILMSMFLALMIGEVLIKNIVQLIKAGCNILIVTKKKMKTKRQLIKLFFVKIWGGL